MKVRMAGHISRVGYTHNEFAYSYTEEVVPFGAALMRGTNKETQCKLFNAGGKFLGVVLAKQLNSADKQEFKEKSSIEILTRGYVFVQVATPVVAGDKAAVGVNGTFSISGTASYDDVDGEFLTSSEANGYAELKLK